MLGFLSDANHEDDDIVYVVLDIVKKQRVGSDTCGHIPFCLCVRYD